MADHYGYHCNTEAPGAPQCLYASFQQIGLSNDIYQKPLVTCNNQLIKLEKDTQADATSSPEPSSCLDMEAAAGESEENLAEYNCSSMQRCHVCDKLLYDLVQGLHYHDPAFGIDLAADAAAPDADVPRVVVKCVSLVDKWCQSDKAKSATVYVLSGSEEEIQAVRTALASGEEHLVEVKPYDGNLPNVKCYDVHSITGVLKKYLRELPNPVIPEEMYDMFLDFIETGNVTSSGKTVTTLVDLVNEMPIVHRSTLKCLLAHISRLLRWQSETDVQESHEKLIHVFSNILIRPPWNRISELTENTKFHNDVLQELLREGCWGELMPPLPSPMGFQPPPPAPQADARGFAPQSAEERLRDAPWYWGDIHREEASELMRHQQERSFIVRDASTPGDYTLMLKFQNAVKLIKILSRDNRYGFVEPLEFPSVVTLINWYQCNNMDSYNSSLNTKLVFPVIRNITPEKPSGSLAQEVENLLRINQRYRKQRALYDYLYEWYSWLAVDTQLKCQACDAYREMINMFTEQIKGLRSSVGARANQEMERLNACRDRVQSCQKSLSDDVLREQGKYRLINGELNITKLEIQKLHKQRELWKTWLKERGMKQNFINKLAELDQSVWLVHCQRPEAELILRGKLDGTFLIRPKPEEKVEVLSIVYQGAVTHCKILHEGDNYGFSQHNLPFTSLKDLVDYHHYRSLASHNDELDICLLYPVHMQEPADAREL